MALTDTITPQLDTRAPIAVLVADEHPLIIAGLRRVLERLADIEIVGEARSCAELVHLVERRQPRIVLVDPSMGGSAALGAIARIRRDWPGVQVVALSAPDERSAVEAALGAGASAYVLKSAPTDDVSVALRRVCGGSPVPAPALSAGPNAPRVALTGRERDILSAVSSGQTTAAISRELFISQHTIKFHLTNIYRKLGVSNRASAIRWALEAGIV